MPHKLMFTKEQKKEQKEQKRLQLFFMSLGLILGVAINSMDLLPVTIVLCLVFAHCGDLPYGITYRSMMGEYIIYHHGKIAAYLCDDRLLVKNISCATKMMPDAVLELPYEGAKPMLLVDNVDDRRFLKALFETMYPELPEPK